MKISKKNIIIISFLIILSIVYTILVKVVDVRSIGPNDSSVGFSLVNEFFNNLIGENKFWYYITEVLGVFSILLALFYSFIGLAKFIKTKNLLKVNKEILALGVFYVTVLVIYLFFEKVIINYRPVLVNGLLEASYPSSHTILSLCICGSSIIVNKKLYSKKRISKIINPIAFFIMILTTVGRLLSGMHWISDILGGIIISITLLYVFSTVINLVKKGN